MTVQLTAASLRRKSASQSNLDADEKENEFEMLGAEVVVKRQREREVTTSQEFRDELSDRLTDKQETVLRTAFFADYFESPHRSSSAEVASALDITGPHAPVSSASRPTKAP